MTLRAPSLLVVDDNFENRDMLSRRLIRKGYTVSLAEGGKEAIEMVRTQAFDLVLLDLMMPGINGLDVLKFLRKDCSASALPVIMVSAKGETESVVDALSLGANDYVTKPLNFPVVLARIESQISRKRAEEELKLAKDQLEIRVAERTEALQRSNERLHAELSERRRVVEVLCESEERFRTSFEDAPIGMAISSCDGKLVKVNKALCEALGYSEQELMPCNLADLTHPEDAKESAQCNNELFLGHINSYKLEKRFFNKNREVIWVALTAALIPYQSGTSLYRLTMIENISERKMAELEMREAQSAAEAAHAAKFQVLSSKGQELYAPGRDLLGRIESTLKTQLTDQQQQCLESAKGFTQASMAIIESLMDQTAHKVQTDEYDRVPASELK